MTGDTTQELLLRYRKVFGRRKGKALRASQQALMDDLLPSLSVPGITAPLDPSRKPIDITKLFGRSCPLWLEVGFGGGEHIAHQAAENPDVGIIGCEPYLNGVAMLLTRIASDGQENIRIHPGDARNVIEQIPGNKLDRVFVLYPDPWPKARHASRRFVSLDNLERLFPAMKPGAHLRLATDIPQYVEHALEAIDLAEGFEVVKPDLPDWSVPWADWPGTRYEAKALREGRKPHYLTFIRK